MALDIIIQNTDQPLHCTCICIYGNTCKYGTMAIPASNSIQECLEDDRIWSSLFFRHTTLAPDAWRTHDNDDCTTWDEWEREKRTLSIVGIVLVVTAVLMLVGGVLLAVFKRDILCKSSQGIVHQPAPAASVVVGGGGVSTVRCTTSFRYQFD